MQQLKSSLGICDENGIRGWVIDTHNPNERLEVEIFIDGELIVKTLANIFRQDLLDNGIGDGYCAFHVAIPNKFFDGIEHSVAVKEVVTGVLVTGSPKTFTLKRLKGTVDFCDENGIGGWAIDMTKPHVPVELEIFIDDSLVFHITANLFRQDLFDTKLGKGNCAFNVSIPGKFLDGVEHSVSIQEVVTKTGLQGSPKIFKLFPNVRGAIDRCDETGIFGWVINENNPSQSVEIDIFIDDELIAHTTANLFRQDLLDVKLGNSNYGFMVPILDKFFDNKDHVISLYNVATNLPIVISKIDLWLNTKHQIIYNPNLFVCDFAFVLNNDIIILIGYVTKDHKELDIRLFHNKIKINLIGNIVYYFRSDLLVLYPWSHSINLGFICVVNFNLKYNLDDDIYLILDYNNKQQRLLIKPQKMLWITLYEFIEKHKYMVGNLFKLLNLHLNANDKSKLNKFISNFYYNNFNSNYLSAQTSLFQDYRIFFAIDYAYSLNTAGILIFGWQIIFNSKFTIYVYDDNNNKIDITNKFFLISRKDVLNSYKTRFPDINEYCGFVCLIPLVTKPNDLRMILIDFEELDEYSIKIPVNNENKQGIALIKEIFSKVPMIEPNRLYQFFEQVLGNAIIDINQHNKIDVTERLIITQYGTPIKQPTVSVIIPLYGRYDFIRYQLSHFTDDKDFQFIDLIYVIDDPNIIIAANEYATMYQPVFNIPFRTVSYGYNLGFAGANNVGVSFARTDVILLMNSDILPKQSGWITILKTHLESLLNVGAVAPLLQFADDSIQHAGMITQRNTRFPGFLFNIHPNKGQPWYGTDEPYQCAMLTGACLMLNKQVYLNIGGLDESYILGDFEDSDLCLALRKQGKTLWLVPKAKLWHLERQSQNLNSEIGFRQLLTLHNAWIFQNKIRNDLIANPEV